MTEVSSLLAEALTELPGGPIVPPVGLGARGARRQVARRRVGLVAALVAVLAVGGGAAVVVTPRHGPIQVGTNEAPIMLTTCVTPPGLFLAPAGRAPVHSSVQATEAVLDVLRKRSALQDLSVGAATLALRSDSLVWVVEELTGAPGGHRYGGQLWLLADSNLAATTSSACALRTSLDGATSEPNVQRLVRAGEAKALLPTAAVAPLTREDASLPWFYGGTRQGERLLEIAFGTGCHEQRSVQVEQTSTYVLIQVVRHGPQSSALCFTRQDGRVLLNASLGSRLVLHAPLRELLPSKAYDRSPAYLPVGAVSISDAVNHSLRTRIWSLPDGRHLSLFVGIRSLFDRLPRPVPLVSYAARNGFFRGQPDLQWEEGGVPLELRLSRSNASTVDLDGPLLLRVAQSLYTQEYLGLTLEQATALASSYGLGVRRVVVDGRQLPIPLPDGPSAIDLVVTTGRVTAASFG
jgi:hypothetical protein